MASVGAHLRDLRERRGLSLEEIARATRVAYRYLEALESDAFGSLPAPVFTRGFIRAYCQALGEPPDDALALFDSRIGLVATSVVRSAPPRPAEREPRTRGAVLVSFVLLVVLGMALFAVTLMIQPRGGERGERVAAVDGSAPAREPSPPAADERPAPSPPVTPPPAGERPAPSAAVTSPPAGARPAPSAGITPPPAAERPAPSATSTRPPAPPAAPPAPAMSPGAVDLQATLASVSAPFHLIARTSEMTWIRVRTEDGRVSEENVPAGQVREWVSDRPFVLTIGNAGGVSFMLNGRALPALGGSGAVISRIVLPPDGR